MSIDGTYIRTHQHASGARRGEERAIGKSAGGATTKIHMACDAHGNSICFEVTEGQVHDSKAAPSLIKKVEGENLRKSNSKKSNHELDKHTYKARHQVENVFARLKL